MIHLLIRDQKIRLRNDLSFPQLTTLSPMLIIELQTGAQVANHRDFECLSSMISLLDSQMNAGPLDPQFSYCNIQERVPTADPKLYPKRTGISDYFTGIRNDIHRLIINQRLSSSATIFLLQCFSLQYFSYCCYNISLQYYSKVLFILSRNTAHTVYHCGTTEDPDSSRCSICFQQSGTKTYVEVARPDMGHAHLDSST